MPQPTDDGKTYTFKIRDGVKFHDGSPLTAADVAASWQRDHLSAGRRHSARGRAILRDGRQGRGARPDDRRLSPEIRRPSAFLPALADPFAWIYKKEILDKDPHWYEKNILGSGPFKFVGYETGQSIKGERNPDYYHQGLPYLDGFIGIYAPTSRRSGSMRSAPTAPRSSSAACRPSARDELVKALGDKITVQESDWNCGNLLTQPQEKAVRRCAGAPRADPGDRPLARRAGARPRSPIVQHGRRHRLSRLAAGGDQGGAAADRRLSGPTSRSRAPRRKRLLKEAGAEGLSFELLNRNVDQPYKYVGTLADRRVEQDRPQGHAAGACRPAPGSRACAAAISTSSSRRNCQSVVNPLLDVQQVSAGIGLRRELRQLRRPEGGRALQQDAARDRSGEAAAR